MVPKCEYCGGVEVDGDIERVDINCEDETVYLTYEADCPCCGRIYRWDEPYVWIGDITNIEVRKGD